MIYQLYRQGRESLPAVLRNMPDPPKQLFWAGGPLDPLLQKPRVAIVGSRKVSSYGRQITHQLAGELSRYGVVVVSGLALGVDAVAHRGALEAGCGTIAVLPCSLDKLYPANNDSLGRQIAAAGGSLVSEYAAGTPFLHKYNFVARNRIIAGLSDAVLITEAAEGSGSLHTAQFALEQGKEVLVVPGNITSPTSAGTNNLLKIGATPVTSVADILSALKLDLATPKPQPPGRNPAEQQILNLISQGVNDGEELQKQSGLAIAEFNQALTMLEIAGSVRAGGGNTWV